VRNYQILRTFDPNSFRIFSNLASANRKKIKPGTGWEYRATEKAELARRFSSKFSLVRPALPPSSVVLPTDQARCRFYLMKGNLRTISLIALVAAPVIAGLTLSAQAANVVAQELNGKLVGGYTVRAHYNELSPQQKQEFDRKADFKIGKQ